MLRRVLFSIFVLFCCELPTHSQQTTLRTIEAVRVTTPPKIDGNLDDACWKTLPSSSGFSDTTLGTLVKDDTTVWIGYDEKNLYVACYCHDSQPKGIIAQETKRGASFSGEDTIAISLNPFYSKRWEQESSLQVNPLGTQQANFAGGRATKHEWEGIWQSAAKIVADGWTVEMAIPWRNFARPAVTGKPVTLGLNFARYQARTQVHSAWSNLGIQERPELGGKWVGVVLPPEEKAVKPLSLLAYAFGGYDQHKLGGRAGLDARYQFTPLLTGVATYNPDFSNVEGDVTSIDFSYSERLPSEQRPFFLEGGQYLGGRGGFAAFRSVRVPQFDLGAKFYGRVGQGTDFGILTTQSFRGRNDSVLNVRREFSPFASAGFQAVSREEEGIHNRVLVGTGQARFGDWNLFGGYGRSFDQTGGGEQGGLSLFWGSKSWSFFSRLERVSSNFQVRDGFVPFQNQQGYRVGINNFSDWRSGAIRHLGGSIGWNDYAHTDGTFFRNGISLDFFLQTASQLSFFMDYSSGRFEQNRDHVTSIGVNYPSLNKFRNFGVTYSWGRQGGSPYSSVSPALRWRFFNRLSVALSTEIVRLTSYNEQDILTLSYDLSRDQALGGRLVRRGGKTNWYLSFRRSGYAGTEYFLILGDPNAETFTSRLVFKVIRQF